jgi:surface polysaccharide O-acyltransferase-like enzyme
LFFNNFSIKSYKQKVSKRFYTLFVPYVFWSFLTVLIYFILQSIPGVQHFFKNTFIANYTIFELFNITWINPRNFPLWFLRDLMLLVILSPIIFYFIKNHTKLYFIVIVFLWFAITQSPVEFSYYKTEPILFFSLGAYISLLNNSILSIKLNDRKLLLLFIIYFILLFSKTIIITLYDINYLFLHKFSILIGIVLFWFLLDTNLTKNKLLLFLSKFTFLYYVFHEPGLKILKKSFYSILGKTPLSSIILYVLLPIFIISLLTILGIIMKKYIPKTTKIITGNRL